jgi:hypothetical protein
VESDSMGRAGLCKISGKNIEIPKESFVIFNHSLKSPTFESLYGKFDRKTEHSCKSKGKLL